MVRLVIICSAFFLLSSSLSAEPQFKVGQVYQTLIEIKKDGDKIIVPLPEGKWEVAAVGSRPTQRSGGTSTAADFGSRLIDVYVCRQMKNTRPPHYECDALPTELRRLMSLVMTLLLPNALT